MKPPTGTSASMPLQAEEGHQEPDRAAVRILVSTPTDAGRHRDVYTQPGGVRPEPLRWNLKGVTTGRAAS